MIESPVHFPMDFPIESFSELFSDVDDSRELAEKEKGLLLDAHTFTGKGVRPDLSSLEELLAKEMEHLSFEEREKAAFDVHGVSLSGDLEEGDDGADGTLTKSSSTASQEVSAMEREKLQQLDKELQKYSCRDSPLVRDQDYRLMFLRCDDYDVKVAAQRINRNMRVKRELFGEELLHRRLKVSDLSPEEQLLFGSPFGRVLSRRDEAGRVVCCLNHTLRPLGTTIKNIQRFAYVRLMENAAMPDIQRDGMVIVVLFTGKPMLRNSFERWEIMKATKDIRLVVPRRIAGVHFCLDNTFGGNEYLYKVIPLATQLIMRKDIRSRFRQHVGDKETLMNKLKSYGIHLTHEDWPEAPTYPVAQRKHEPNDESDSSYTTASSRRSISSAITSTCFSSSPAANADPLASFGTITPTDSDVLLGRGKYTRTHPGNIQAGKIVDAHRAEYEAAKKFEKTAIAERIVRNILDSGGRFLKFCEEEQEWEEVDAQTARNKISHMYRNTRKK